MFSYDSSTDMPCINKNLKIKINFVSEYILEKIHENIETSLEGSYFITLKCKNYFW